MDRLKRWFEFNRWYLRREPPPWDTGVSPPELLAFIEAHPPGRALDLGCGTGTNVITLAQHGWQVTGVDFAVKDIMEAGRKAREASVQADLRLGDVTRLSALAGPFDLILDIGCFHGLPADGRSAYARHVKRLLAPDGTFLLYVMFKADAQSPRGGIPATDLARFAPELALVARTDGVDAARGRPSAWLAYRCASSVATIAKSRA
ncbi:class I SAM-dependent methyltransferase [Candidatus Roseilinea sp. NK_OTU-006]|jgi:2-polyprenyl-3-methyl-5-hydroxy-6-metoxy-1,4-benzoquinol methylase|uniref:class I SAM-dependent methyltransferase n=1 Tax=Candidatus Roseilinea sp. NK_OTU-006 TaxID=2704250 RepID=UPI00145D91F9|nr:class I SAM-dependent methyltransferase [Candidatus Roseilinea sp. NK_OTU-006]